MARPHHDISEAVPGLREVLTRELQGRRSTREAKRKLQQRFGRHDDKAARQSAAEAAARQGESQVDYADLAMYSPGVDVDAERTQTLVKAAKETPDTTTAVQQTFLA